MTLAKDLEGGLASALGAHGIVLGVPEQVVAAELAVPGLLMPEASDEEAHRADEQAVADKDDAHVVDLEATIAQEAHPPMQNADEGDEGHREQRDGEALPASAILGDEKGYEDGIEGEEEHCGTISACAGCAHIGTQESDRAYGANGEVARRTRSAMAAQMPRS